MSSHTQSRLIIVDVTGAHRGSVARCLEGVDAIRGPEVERAVVVAQRAQQIEVNAYLADRGDWEPLLLAPSLNSLEGDVLEAVRRVVSDASGVQAAVFSFSPAVLLGVRALDVEPAVYDRRLGDVVVPLRSPTPTEWAHPEIGAAEAADRLVSVLATSRGKAAQVDLRPMLQAQDPRFAKTASSASAAMGFVSGVVAEATRRGLVRTSGAHPQVTVHLTDAGRRRAQDLGNLSVVAPEGEPSPSASSDPPVSRSLLFGQTLQRSGFGPFARYRWSALEAIELEWESSEAGVSASELVARGITATRKAATEETGRYPWGHLLNLVEHLMSLRPVLQDESGEPLVWDVESDDIAVYGFAPGWKETLDGLLVEALKQQGLGVSHRDLPALAQALYGASGETEYLRTARVVRALRAQDPPAARKPASL